MVLTRKLGQMKIQQMAFMLIAVTLFFALVGLFVLVIVFSNLRGTADLLEEKNALFTVSKLADSGEFNCGSAFGSSRTNCVDADKVMALKQNIVKYTGFWGVNGIEVRLIDSDNMECTEANYPDCDVISVLKPNGGTGVSNFVSFCRKEQVEGIVQNRCDMARLIVTYNAEVGK